jgi:heme-degrading monooxygenase HmoA
MVLELVEIECTPGSEDTFEAAYRAAVPLLQRAKGFVSMQIVRGIELPNQFRVLVYWETLESHTREFRESEDHHTFIKMLENDAEFSRLSLRHWDVRFAVSD